MNTSTPPAATPPDATLYLLAAPSPSARRDNGTLVRELERHRRRALHHLARRGFGDIAEDAFQEALLRFVRKAREPGFVPPVVPKAWLFRWSVCSAHVLRREGHRLDTVSFDEAVEAFAHACNQAADDDTSSPDARLVAAADAEEAAAWRVRVTGAREAFLPQDRATLDREVTRADEGAVADAPHRKRLERARRRTILVLAERGIRSPHPPAALR